ncbi:DUF4214 domain-containing protein [Pseudoduganella namucuonensis]|uniref:DUF4214 domain-containing protein n=1 Tax=Pseudoduganella namucuonensis TaxID=1035707 RepID=A0A1I7IAJ8_9BURK|nr:DUF4214 domain-containing protein [Pseudoduganella namucuonensis]SFU69948.1 protein of unknown function [Pseudoduganella namucuonensis]
MTRTADIQQLYIAYFGRPPEPVGLAYWVKVDASIDAISGAFAASREYADQYAGKSTTDVVKALYHNLFGRAGDPAGVAYWSKQVDSGAIEIGRVAPALLGGAQGRDATVLANKLAYCDAFGQLVTELPGFEAIYAGNTDLSFMRAGLAMVTDHTPVSGMRDSINDLISQFNFPHAPGKALVVNLQGTGYLQGADITHGGVASSIESNEYGNFIHAAGGGWVPDIPAADYYVTGGVDTTTGLAYQGMLRVGGGTTAASPLASLYEELDALGLGAADANARIAAALDLAGVDALAAAPLTAAFDALPGSAEQLRAQHLQAASINLDIVQTAIARTLVALAGGEGQLAVLAAGKAALGAVAASVAAGAFDLDNGGTLGALLARAVKLADNAALTAAHAKLGAASTLAFGSLLEASAANVELGMDRVDAGVYAPLARMGQAAALAQGELVAKLAAAMAADTAGALLPLYTGSALLAATAATRIKDIAPATHDDDAAIAAANGGHAFAALVGLAPNDAIF